MLFYISLVINGLNSMLLEKLFVDFLIPEMNAVSFLFRYKIQGIHWIHIAMALHAIKINKLIVIKLIKNY